MARRVVCGADGCPGGWVAITKDLDTGVISWRLCANATELFFGKPTAQVIAIDIPIGLPERGARDCDRAARQLLRPGRASSVFPAPIRPILAARDYRDACQIGLRVEGKKLSKQAWLILPKIAEVEAALRRSPSLPARVHEVHPEVSFYFLAGGRPLAASKKRPSGRAERQRLLEPVFGPALDRALDDRCHLRSAPDDVLDAFAALWTAERIAAGRATTLPPTPPADRFGLRMEIVA